MGSTDLQTPEEIQRFWSEEETGRSGYKRIRARIGGLHCSLYTSTIEQALGRQRRVEKVPVSLENVELATKGRGYYARLRPAIPTGSSS